ncbi:MAG: hypothetical protein NTY48_04705, partial [Candidatus Diapherotrites archaeon]|nr:hypothetical protein [Candidatus Diapherotrites archaeon]
MKSAPSLETQKMQEFDLPKDWSKQELKKIAEVLYGKSNPAKTGEIPLVGSSGVYAWTNDPLINYPTLIIGRKGSAGQVHLFTTPCFPSDTTFYLKIDFKKVDLHYLYYY